MKAYKKDFEEMSIILGRNNASNQLIDEISFFFIGSNPKYQKQTFKNTCKKERMEWITANKS